MNRLKLEDAVRAFVSAQLLGELDPLIDASPDCWERVVTATWREHKVKALTLDQMVAHEEAIAAALSEDVKCRLIALCDHYTHEMLVRQDAGFRVGLAYGRLLEKVGA